MQFGNFEQSQVVERAGEGLRAFFSQVYNYMAGGLAVSGVVAYFSVKEPFINWFYTITPQGISFSLLGWIAILSPLLFIFMISSAVNKMNPARAGGLFIAFSAAMGVSLSNVFLVYTHGAIFQAFLVTAGAFGALSFYGAVTKRDLSGWGSFLMMGLFGVIIALLVNFFMKSPAINYALSIISVFIFVGLTAYDTQKLKMMYGMAPSADARKAMAISGALALYLDFINLFRLVLYFMGDRK